MTLEPGHVIAAVVGSGALIKASQITYRAVKRIETIHHVVMSELVPNGGGALVDRVGAIESHLNLDTKRAA